MPPPKLGSRGKGSESSSSSQLISEDSGGNRQPLKIGKNPTRKSGNVSAVPGSKENQGKQQERRPVKPPIPFDEQESVAVLKNIVQKPKVAKPPKEGR